jgi:hypothetical protein
MEMECYWCQKGESVRYALFCLAIDYNNRNRRSVPVLDLGLLVISDPIQRQVFDGKIICISS